MKKIPWRTDIETAREEVSGGTRMLLLCFHDHTNEGSKKMLGEVLPDDRVLSIIERESAPVLFDIHKDVEMAEKFKVDWTPTFILVDSDGIERERWVGYLPTDDFIAQIILAKGIADFHISRLEDAEREFEQLIGEHCESDLVPEAEYYLAVTRYKETGDSIYLGEACDRMKEKFPDSHWTKKCSVWSGVGHEARARFVGYDQGGSGASGAY